MRGTIKSLKDTFGFIKGAEDGVDYFFLPRAVLTPGIQFNTLRIGQAVEFAPGQGERGPRASDVKIL